MRRSQEEQRVRLRAARQRVRRVRPRERDEGEHAPRRPGRWDLATWGTVITIAVGLAGLLLTGIGTFYGAWVARDQLEQSREDAETKRRAHATRVSTWADRKPDGTWRVHVANRSPDPVTGIGVSFEAFFDDPDNRQVSIPVAWPSIPPCAELVIEQETLRHWDRRTVPGREVSFFGPLQGRLTDVRKLAATPERVVVHGVQFTDRNGVLWSREEEGLRRGPLGFVAHGFALQGAVEENPKVQPVELCGADAAG
ncbi:hypothetical protein [Streptomyces synnematoformans]|uniref:Uncharacterized protein n=1 Tax=Streptomyces synnematoformans TaxID=415721 RepID=A0ABP4KHN7_9ACTN